MCCFYSPRYYNLSLNLPFKTHIVRRRSFIENGYPIRLHNLKTAYIGNKSWFSWHKFPVIKEVNWHVYKLP